MQQLSGAIGFWTGNTSHRQTGAPRRCSADVPTLAFQQFLVLIFCRLFPVRDKPYIDASVTSNMALTVGTFSSREFLCTSASNEVVCSFLWWPTWWPNHANRRLSILISIYSQYLSDFIHYVDTNCLICPSSGAEGKGDSIGGTFRPNAQQFTQYLLLNFNKYSKGGCALQVLNSKWS